VVGNAMAHRGERSRWSRIAALRVLALGRPHEAWKPLERALLDPDREVVGAAVTTLGNMTDVRAAELLVRTLRAGQYPPSRVSTFLDAFPRDLFDLLGPLLDRPSSRLRYWGAVLLRRYPGREGLDTALAALADDAEPFVRKAAIESLGTIGGAVAMKAAQAHLADPVGFVRAHAARALGALKATETAGQVTALLADREWWVRYAAKVSLEAMGPEIAAHVVPYLSSPDAFARNGAAEVLQNLGVFERLLVEEANGSSRPGRMQILALLTRAGGVQMSEVVLDRLAPDARERAGAIMRDLKVERAAVTAAGANT
jgi:HEAT repeat protein